MKHEKFSELLVLSLYGEISDHEDALLAEHLSHCHDCVKERNDLAKFHSVLLEENSETLEQLLWQARNELFLRLRQESRKSNSRLSWAHLLSLFRWNWATAAGALTALSIGFFIGYLSFAPAVDTELDPFGSDDVKIANLLLEETGDVEGEIQLTFEAARSFRLKGNISDRKIQRLLAYALINEQNAGVRLRAVSSIRDENPADADKHIQKALVVALKRDENPAVRQQALMALQKYPFDEDIGEALVHVLMHDQNAKLRMEAINVLEMARSSGQQLEQEVLGALQQKLQTDENKYIRLRAKAVLEEAEPQFF